MLASSSNTALECRLGLGRIALPTGAIELLGEYPVGAPLPLSGRVACAIGVWDDKPILSVALGERATQPSRTVNGVLLTGLMHGLRCALEIDEPVGLVHLTAVAAPTASPWRRSATLGDGRTVQLIDIATLLHEIAGLA